jgi:hypothetical protein
MNCPSTPIEYSTAEIAEHAEVEMAKYPRPGCRGKSGPLSHFSRKLNKASRDFPGTISALSAPSSFILLSSILQDRMGKRDPYLSIE